MEIRRGLYRRAGYLFTGPRCFTVFAVVMAPIGPETSAQFAV